MSKEKQPGERNLPRRLNKEKRYQIARECLRQLWQNFDAGGTSMGRSLDALLLEIAIDLLEDTRPYDGNLNNFADTKSGFLDLAREARYQANKEASDRHFKSMGLD